MAEAKGVLLPAYVVADESGSMAPYQRELGDGVASLCEGLRAEPMVAAKLRLAVLGFSDDVQVRLAVADMRTETTVPRLVIRGVTNYRAVFEDLLQRIPGDVKWLRGEGYRVHRPVVFLLSDGQPTDGSSWHAPHAELTDRDRTPTAPNIIACGLGDARAQTMVDVATRPEFAFLAKSGTDVGRAISEFFHSLTMSLVASGHALNSANPQLVVNRPDQFTMAIDEVGR
ncbi:VWA domain-containing protein [Kitasatospora sp. NPDC085895]|uniref:vWA domain-containing protein n=1 Tax=Actinomycetes TaxID=1760 RepID=UPI0005ED20E8|nr:VWA domain-containing protein [Saccharothrix sp. ST-888]KJK55341.1 von Willebrand factor type A domain protein [Saccharothrix sp. ST-888]